jgi:hypothetical protein
MNRRMPNGTYGGVRGWGREAPAYSIIMVWQRGGSSYPSLEISARHWFDNLAFLIPAAEPVVVGLHLLEVRFIEDEAF